MNRFFVLMALFFCLVLPVHAFNLIDFPNELIVSNEPIRLSFLIENNSGFNKNLELNYTFPSQVIQNYVPRKIFGGKKDRVTLTVLPEPELINSSYVSLIEIKLGNEIIQKNLVIKYVEAEKTIEKPIEEENGFISGLIGFISLPGIDLSNLVINLILLLIVSVLMISFISRLVNFLNSKNNNSKEFKVIQEETHSLSPRNKNLTRLRKTVLEEKK